MAGIAAVALFLPYLHRSDTALLERLNFSLLDTSGCRRHHATVYEPTIDTGTLAGAEFVPSTARPRSLMEDPHKAMLCLDKEMSHHQDTKRNLCAESVGSDLGCRSGRFGHLHQTICVVATNTREKKEDK